MTVARAKAIRRMTVARAKAIRRMTAARAASGKTHAMSRRSTCFQTSLYSHEWSLGCSGSHAITVVQSCAYLCVILAGKEQESLQMQYCMNNLPGFKKSVGK